MTETQLIIVGFYLLVGLFLADTFLVKVDSNYWLFLLFYPLIIAGFFVTFIGLWVALKLYEIEERLG